MILLVLANLPIFVLALASGLAVGEEKTAEAKRAVERTAALAAAREAASVGRIAGAVEAVVASGGDGLCPRIARVLQPIEPTFVALRFDDPLIGSCEAAALEVELPAEALARKVAAAAAAEPRRQLALRLSNGGRYVVELAAQADTGPLADIALAAGESLAILDSQGTVVAATGAMTDPAALAALGRTIGVVHANRFEAKLPDGSWVFLALQHVADSDLVAVATSPLATIEASARRDLLVAVGLSLAFLVIAVVVAWWGVDRLVARWVARLSRVASLYGAGRQSVRVGRLEGAPQEIRVLGATFDEMADRVERRSKELVAALDGKTDLLRELHHRVKNNFQLVASLLSLESREATEEQADSLRMQQRRIHAMAIAHRLAYATGDVGDVPVGPLVAEVVQGLRQSVGLPLRLIRVDTVDDDVVVDLDTAIPLALLVTELACPIAFAAIETGEPIAVRQTIAGRDMALTLLGPHTRPRDALSARLIPAFARQLDATVSLAPPGPYSVRLTLRRPEARQAPSFG